MVGDFRFSNNFQKFWENFDHKTKFPLAEENEQADLFQTFHQR